MTSKIEVPRELLEDLQWHWRDIDHHWHKDAGYYCPSCEENKGKGHSPDCDIALLLAAPEAPRQEPVAAFEVSHGPMGDDGAPIWVRLKDLQDFDIENLADGTKLYLSAPAPLSPDHSGGAGEVVLVSEAWVACGGNPGIDASSDELLSALRLINEAEDESVVLPTRGVLHDLIAQVIGGDTYDCTRVWSAWGIGTMSEDDFVPFVDQDERLYELADALLDKVKELNQ